MTLQIAKLFFCTVPVERTDSVLKWNTVLSVCQNIYWLLMCVPNTTLRAGDTMAERTDRGSAFAVYDLVREYISID